MYISESSVLHGLSYDSCARANIKAAGTAIYTHASILLTEHHLVDDMIWLSKVDNSCPLIVPFRGKTCIPRGNVLLFRQVSVELIDYKSTLFGLGLASLTLILLRDIPLLLLAVLKVNLAFFKLRS